MTSSDAVEGHQLDLVIDFKSYLTYGVPCFSCPLFRFCIFHPLQVCATFHVLHFMSCIFSVPIGTKVYTV